ncbi:hypothetical protein, partial [Bradyrhizobium sp. RT3b]|uniref:hypothetical protein n=1 Tax=Bradyrhizobium sp. RT3b TaxID=3156334 RepID=UPI00339A6FEC
AAFVRIGWPLSIGIAGRLPSESVAALPRIPQGDRRKDEKIIHSIFFPMRKDSTEVASHDICF